MSEKTATLEKDREKAREKKPFFSPLLFRFKLLNAYLLKDIVSAHSALDNQLFETRRVLKRT